MRSKSAKIVLWVLLGLTAASLIALIAVFVIDMLGGTGTNYHWPEPVSK